MVHGSRLFTSVDHIIMTTVVNSELSIEEIIFVADECWLSGNLQYFDGNVTYVFIFSDIKTQRMIMDKK